MTECFFFLKELYFSGNDFPPAILVAIVNMFQFYGTFTLTDTETAKMGLIDLCGGVQIAKRQTPPISIGLYVQLLICICRGLCVCLGVGQLERTIKVKESPLNLQIFVAARVRNVQSYC